MLDGSVIERGRKNRTNIRKQVVRNPVTLHQTIRRRVLLTGGSGVDSTTTAGVLAGGFAGTLAANGAAPPSGVPVVIPVLELLSTPLTSPASRKNLNNHTATTRIVDYYTIPRGTGIKFSAKTIANLFTRSAPRPKE